MPKKKQSKNKPKQQENYTTREWEHIMGIHKPVHKRVHGALKRK